MTFDFISQFNHKEQQQYAKRTGIVVDIQNIGKNTGLIAVKEHPHAQELKPGVWLEKKMVEFADGNFTNVYDLFWNPAQIGIAANVHSSNRPYSLYTRFKRDSSMIAAINGSFFFLTDVAETQPHDLPYDFCVRDGKVIGLPSSDEPIVYIQETKLHTIQVKARGVLRIAGKNVMWVGAKSSGRKQLSQARLFNSKCATILKVREKKTNVQIGILDTTTITTPTGENIVDVVVAKRKTGLYVKQVVTGGGSHFHGGVFILQMQGNVQGFAKGDKVEALELDGLDLATISSGVTLGKKVTDRFFLEAEREANRDARSILAQDKQGYLHFIIYDGSKYVPGFRGVSAKDITPFFGKRNFVWAYFLDGGGSSRLLVREHRKIGIYANQFAFRKVTNGAFLWDWRRARKIASSVSLHTVEN